MRITFKQVSVRNFLSYGDDLDQNTIFIDTGQMSLITGPNGCGKSAILLDSLCFALYGKAFRKINKEQLINSVNTKNTEVHLDFEVNSVPYRVIRGMRPAVFEIYKKGELIEQSAKVRDYQNILDSIIGCSYSTFTNLIIMGSASYDSFMNLPIQQRRQIVTHILDIEVFNYMDNILLEKMTENKLLMSDLESQVQVKDREITVREEELNKNANSKSVESLKESLKEERERFKKIYSDFEKNSDLLSQEVERLDNTDHENSEELFTELRKKKNIMEKGIQDLEKRKRFYDDHDHCEVCGQDLEDSFKTDTIKDIENNLGKKTLLIPKFEKKIEKYQNKLKEIQIIREEIGSLESRAKILRVNMKNSRNNAEKIERMIEDSEQRSKERIEEARSMIESLQDELNDLENKLEKEEKMRSVYEIIKMLLKDNGIKAQIIKQWLPTINLEINRVLDRLEASYSFHLDEQFNETIRSRYRDAFSYSSFSEGEKSRIDAAILFAFREVAKSKSTINCNILVLDEILDGSLDAEAAEILLGMLKEQDLSIFVVSHKIEASNHFPNIIEIEKRGNFSHIK